MDVSDKGQALPGDIAGEHVRVVDNANATQAEDAKVNGEASAEVKTSESEEKTDSA